MPQGQGPGGPPTPRWGYTHQTGPGGSRPQSPFRGPPPPRPGWASPIPLRMTQSPPPFLIRPMVGGPPHMRPGSPAPRMGSPVPLFSPPPMPPRWSPAPGTPIPHPMAHGPGTPIPSPMQGPRPFFRPIMPSPTPPVGYPPMMPPPPMGQILSPDFSLQPSYDVEFVYPAGMDPEAHMKRQQMSGPSQSQEEDENGPSTADIIAAQSQDYIDERLAEYQATIQHLQGSEQQWKLLMHEVLPQQDEY